MVWRGPRLRRAVATLAAASFGAYCLIGLRKSGKLSFNKTHSSSSSSGLGSGDERCKVFFSQGDQRMAQILSRLRSQLGAGYEPTIWAHGSFAQLGLLLLWRWLYSGTAHFKQHMLTCHDGGKVCVEEYLPRASDSRAEPLPDSAPVLLILHTISGQSQDESELCARAYARGVRPFVLSRRGHFGEALQTPKFNLLGCAKDTLLMVQFVKEMHPASFICAIGLSAGSGQVVSFLGQRNAGPDRLVDAAVSICPAYDIKDAFSIFRQSSPLLEKYLLNGLKHFFLDKHSHVLSSTRGFEATRNSKSLQEFLEQAVHLAGYESFQDYLEESNPMTHYAKNQVPCLVINSRDDPLCVEANIPFHLVGKTPNYSLVLTECGSHVAYRQGFFGEESWMHRIALDFCESAEIESKK